MAGRSPDGSGSRPSGRASKAVSPVPASIPNAAFAMPIIRTNWRDPRQTFVFVPTVEDRRWSERNHYQTLDRIRERGGFSWCELAAVLEHRDWRAMDEAEARSACAQAIEARRAETLQDGSVHESAVGTADAPNPGQSSGMPKGGEL